MEVIRVEYSRGLQRYEQLPYRIKCAIYFGKEAGYLKVKTCCGKSFLDLRGPRKSIMEVRNTHLEYGQGGYRKVPNVPKKTYIPQSTGEYLEVYLDDSDEEEENSDIDTCSVPNLVTCDDNVECTTAEHVCRPGKNHTFDSSAAGSVKVHVIDMSVGLPTGMRLQKF